MSNATLTQIIDDQKHESFTDPSQATQEEALGIAIAHHFHWDGLAILRVAEAALEDANFHTESALVGQMAQELEQ